MFVEKFNNTVTYFVDLKQFELVRKSKLAANTKQRMLQEAMNNNEVFSNFFTDVLEGRTPIAEDLDPSTISLAFTDVPLDSKDLDYTYWFIDDKKLTYNHLTSRDRRKIQIMTPLYPIWKAFLYDDLASENGVYNTIYYATENERLFFRYPTVGSGTFKNWQRTDLP